MYAAKLQLRDLEPSASIREETRLLLSTIVIQIQADLWRFHCSSNSLKLSLTEPNFNLNRRAPTEFQRKFAPSWFNVSEKDSTLSI